MDVLFGAKTQNYDDLAQIRDKFDIIRLRLWEFYKDLNISKLP
jgi:hypothetical protein